MAQGVTGRTLHVEKVQTVPWRAPDEWRREWRCGGPVRCFACAVDAQRSFGKPD